MKYLLLITILWASGARAEEGGISGIISDTVSAANDALANIGSPPNSQATDSNDSD
jgi:hypothetical protein